jgi:hypothetical protein
VKNISKAIVSLSLLVATNAFAESAVMAILDEVAASKFSPAIEVLPHPPGSLIGYDFALRDSQVHMELNYYPDLRHTSKVLEVYVDGISAEKRPAVLSIVQEELQKQAGFIEARAVTSSDQATPVNRVIAYLSEAKINSATLPHALNNIINRIEKESKF